MDIACGFALKANKGKMMNFQKNLYLVLFCLLISLLMSGCFADSSARIGTLITSSDFSDGALETFEDSEMRAEAELRGAYVWTHDNITDDAFEDAWSIIKDRLSPQPVSDSLKCKIREIISSANKAQDSGDAAKDNRRHYNRDLKSFESFADKLRGDSLYQDYIFSEIAILRAELNYGASALNAAAHATAALQAIGRLSHSYQDFYFHAIRRDGAGGKEFNLRSGFKAWTGYPQQTGNPMERGLFFPSSWNSIWNPGEHGLGEPVGTGTDEKKARLKAAREFCRDGFVEIIPVWWSIYSQVL